MYSIPKGRSFSFQLDTKAKGIDKQREFVKKFLDPTLPAVKDDLFGLLLKHDFIVIEKPFNIKGHGEVLLQLLGIVKYILFIGDIDFCEIPQMTLKKFATGSGKAQKSDMVKRALKEFGLDVETEDEVDAFWCSKVGKALLEPGKFSKARQDALKKVKWTPKKPL